MSNFNVNPIQVAVPGSGPIRYNASTTDSYSAITADGYMTDLLTKIPFKNNDLVDITYDYNLSNGFSVLGQFRISVVDGVASLVALETTSISQQDGMAMVSNTTTTMTFSPGSVTDSAQAFTIRVPNTTVVNLATNGLNGLDTGTFSANTNISVFAIADSTGNLPAGYVASTALDTGAPTLPAGYNKYAFVFGIFSLTGSPALPIVRTHGKDANNLIVQYENTIAAISGGTATSFAAVDLTTTTRTVPTIPGLYTLLQLTTSGGSSAEVRPTGSTASAANAPFVMATTGSGGATASQWLVVGANGSNRPSIDYQITAANNVTIKVIGYQIVV